MLRPFSKSEKLDGRIRDIDRELRELQKAMRELARTGRTSYVPPVPRVRRPAPASATAPRENPAVPAHEPPAASPRETAAPAAAPLEYFETGTGENAGGAPEPAPLPYPPWRRTPSPAPGPATEPAADDKRRFASYFSSGFLPGRPLKGERHTQRNRAIAMFVVVVVLAYILYRVVR